MPSKSKAQFRMMAAEMERRKEGKEPRMKGMKTSSLKHFVKRGSYEKLPERKHVGKGDWGAKEGQSAGASKTLVGQGDMLHDASNSTTLKEYKTN